MSALHTSILYLWILPKETMGQDVYLPSIQNLNFSLCIPAVIDRIQKDIFGSVSEIKEVEGVKKQLIKEASGGKIFSTL